jgi:uncharacterized protein
MPLREVVFAQGHPVDGYGPGFLRIGGQLVRGPVLSLPSGLVPWGGWADTGPLLAAAPALDILLVGTGAEMRPLPPDFRAVCEGAGIGLEFMATPAACRTYNVLLAEARRVGLAALPV